MNKTTQTPKQKWSLKENMIRTVILVLVTMALTNCVADRSTWRDCATKGESSMKGGGTIKCQIDKTDEPNIP